MISRSRGESSSVGRLLSSVWMRRSGSRNDDTSSMKTRQAGASARRMWFSTLERDETGPADPRRHTHRVVERRRSVPDSLEHDGRCRDPMQLLVEVHVLAGVRLGTALAADVDIR
jgi:hypothetical protein